MNNTHNDLLDESLDDARNEHQIRCAVLMNDMNEMKGIIKHIENEENKLIQTKKIVLDNCENFCYSLLFNQELDQQLLPIVDQIIRQIDATKVEDDILFSKVTKNLFVDLNLAFDGTMGSVMKLINYYTDKRQRLAAPNNFGQYIQSNDDEKICEASRHRQQLAQEEESLGYLVNECERLDQSITDTMSKINDKQKKPQLNDDGSEHDQQV